MASSRTILATSGARRSPKGERNQRNGSTPKTVLTEDGAIPIAVPRDRAGTFAPQLIPKNAHRLPRFGQNVLSLYARGMTIKEIREHLEELYQIEVSSEMISSVTDEVMEEVSHRQQRRNLSMILRHLAVRI